MITLYPETPVDDSIQPDQDGIIYVPFELEALASIDPLSLPSSDTMIPICHPFLRDDQVMQVFAHNPRWQQQIKVDFEYDGNIYDTQYDDYSFYTIALRQISALFNINSSQWSGTVGYSIWYNIQLTGDGVSPTTNDDNWQFVHTFPAESSDSIENPYYPGQYITPYPMVVKRHLYTRWRTEVRDRYWYCTYQEANITAPGIIPQLTILAMMGFSLLMGYSLNPTQGRRPKRGR